MQGRDREGVQKPDWLEADRQLVVQRSRLADRQRQLQAQPRSASLCPANPLLWVILLASKIWMMSSTL